MRINKYGVRGLKGVQLPNAFVYFWVPTLSLQKAGIFRYSTLGSDFECAVTKARALNEKLDSGPFDFARYPDAAAECGEVDFRNIRGVENDPVPVLEVEPANAGPGLSPVGGPKGGSFESGGIDRVGIARID